MRVHPAADWLLLAADTVVAGVHADLALTGLDDLGWKAVAASVSDIAAMGGEVGHALVTVAGPSATDLDLLYRGVAAASAEFGCPVVGGDLTNADSLVVTVAVTGYSTGPPVRRDGARPGDGVWVTGPLGAAAAGLRLLRRRAARGGTGAAGTGAGGTATAGTATAGAGSGGFGSGGFGSGAVLAHARPVARLAEGRAARAAGATAMIDISDGLTADLDHVASASGVGLRLHSIPIHPEATPEEALGGGEDFELAFCAGDAQSVEAGFGGLSRPVLIGVCTEDPGERTLDGRPFLPSGWEHSWGGSAAAGAALGGEPVARDVGGSR